MTSSTTTMSSAKPLITVLGSLNIDLVSYVPHHPSPGETLTASSFAVSPGGKGANQAVACAKLSRSRQSAQGGEAAAAVAAGDETVAAGDETVTAQVSMLGAVGSDTYGTILKSNLASHGVDVSGVSTLQGQKTGVAIIVVDEPTGENRIILSPEANHRISPSQFALPSASSPTTKPLNNPRPDLLVMQLEIPLPTVLSALETSRSLGIPVLLNPAPAQPLPDEAYAGLSHLILNETEAATLGGLASESELEDGKALQKVGLTFLGRGVQNVVITLGGRGVFYITGSRGPEKIQGFIPAEKAKVIDTTAAGDTFVGQYALEVVSAKGRDSFDIEAAVRKANRAAAKTVEKLGAQDSIPWRDEL